jgi:hypothetical protein
MIKIFTLNVSEEILNKFKGFEIHSYFDNICIPTAFIYVDDNLKYKIRKADYDRINTYISKLGG